MPVDAHAPDAELVLKAQSGDVDAFEQLVERYSDLAFRSAYLILGAAQDAEDACQEAFYKAFRALSRFQPELPLKPWLLRIVINEARNRRRGNSRRPELATDLEVAAFTAGGPGPEDAAVASDRRERLLRAVNGLPEDDRQVVLCRYFLELSVDETAGALGRPAGTVKSRLSRALDRLRPLLGDTDD
jgi:RNA polymerase sigma-70 factor (ECF subfamily)